MHVCLEFAKKQLDKKTQTYQVAKTEFVCVQFAVYLIPISKTVQNGKDQ